MIDHTTRPAQETVFGMIDHTTRPARIPLRDELRAAINLASAENFSNTPDFVLAEYLVACLDAFDFAINKRAKWYGHAGAGDIDSLDPRV